MTPYGMNIKVVGDKPGMASAMKLIRSVCIKGLSAVLLESLEAAQRYGGSRRRPLTLRNRSTSARLHRT